MNPETRAQRPSLRTHTWETNHFPPRGGDPGKTQACDTQLSVLMSARDPRGPGGARDVEAPLLSGEAGKGKFESRAGMLLTRMVRCPPFSARGPSGNRIYSSGSLRAAAEAAAAASNRPGVAGTGSDFTTSSLGDFSFAARSAP